MHIGKTIPIILLCALLTSCTISHREPEHTPDYTAESLPPEEESAESAEDIPPAPAGEDGYWRHFTETDGEGLFDSSFAEEFSENAVRYFDEQSEKNRQWLTERYGEEEAERIMSDLIHWTVGSVMAVPSENGAFVYKSYYMSYFDTQFYELYFIPKGGESVLLLEDTVNSSYQAISSGWYRNAVAGGSYLFQAPYFGSTLYRLSEDGTLDTLTIPVDDAYQAYSGIFPSEAGRLTMKIYCERTDEYGQQYQKNDVYTIDAEKLEIVGSYTENETVVYNWSQNTERPYDFTFESRITEDARRYFESEKEKAAALSPLTEKEEKQWSDIYTLPLSHSAYGGCYVVKLYGLRELSDCTYYEIYFFQKTTADGETVWSDGVLLHSMSGSENGGSMWSALCDGVRFYFICDGALCRISRDGTLETVLPLGRDLGWELDRYSSEISGEDNQLTARLCYRSTPELMFSSSDNPYLHGFELGTPLQRTDTYTVNLDTLQITNYTAGAVTASQ